MNLERLHSILARGTRAAAASCLAGCVALFGGSLLLLATDVVLRYVFNHPLQNVSEAVTIAFIWVYMLGGAALYARNEDIALDYFFRRAGLRAQAIWLACVHVAIVGTMTVTLVATVRMMLVQRGVLTPALRLPLGIEHGALALAAVVIAYASAVETLGCLLWFRTGRRWPVFEDPRPGEAGH